MKLQLYSALILASVFLPFCESGPPEGVDIQLAVLPDNLAEVLEDTQIPAVVGWPIKIQITMHERAKKQYGYYVHIFQKESGAGVQYFYQGSTAFFHDQKAVLPVWLGREGAIDRDKYFEIIATVNKTEQYEKDTRGIREFTELPGAAIAVLNVQRTK